MTFKCKQDYTTTFRILASVFLFLFASTQSLFAEPANSYRIKVPKEYGKVKERYKGDKEKLVIHIQDAHNSLEAQENISNIIHYLADADVTNVVGLEGAEGEVDVSPLDLVPNPEDRYRLSMPLVEEGYMSGGLLAGVTSEDDLQLFGVENMKLYDRNLDKFKNVLQKKGDILDELDKIEEIINQLKEPVYDEALILFDQELHLYLEGEKDFLDFTKFVIDSAHEQKVDLYEFVNVQLFLESLEGSGDLSDEERDMIEVERSALIMELMALSKKGSFTKLLKKLQATSSEMDDERVLLMDSFLMKQLRAHKIDESVYRNFVSNAKYAEKFGRVDMHALIDDIEEISYQVMMALAGEDQEAKDLIDLQKDLRLMQKMIELRIVPEQYEAFNIREDSFNSTRYVNYLRRTAKKYGMHYHPSSNIVLLDEVMNTASLFYRFADARSRLLVKNTLQHMRFEEQDIMTLVAGGFHTEGITKALKREGYSYLVVSPNLDIENMMIPYMDRMMQLKTTAELRFESAINTLVKEDMMVLYAEGDATARRNVLSYFLGHGATNLFQDGQVDPEYVSGMIAATNFLYRELDQNFENAFFLRDKAARVVYFINPDTETVITVYGHNDRSLSYNPLDVREDEMLDPLEHSAEDVIRVQQVRDAILNDQRIKREFNSEDVANMSLEEVLFAYKGLIEISHFDFYLSNNKTRQGITTQRLANSLKVFNEKLESFNLQASEKPIAAFSSDLMKAFSLTGDIEEGAKNFVGFVLSDAYGTLNENVFFGQLNDLVDAEAEIVILVSQGLEELDINVLNEKLERTNVRFDYFGDLEEGRPGLSLSESIYYGKFFYENKGTTFFREEIKEELAEDMYGKHIALDIQKLRKQLFGKNNRFEASSFNFLEFARSVALFNTVDSSNDKMKKLNFFSPFYSQLQEPATAERGAIELIGSVYDQVNAERDAIFGSA